MQTTHQVILSNELERVESFLIGVFYSVYYITINSRPLLHLRLVSVA